MKCGSSFHDAWNDRIVSVISAGRAIGSTTDQNIRKVPAPSIRAASSTSSRDRLEELLHDEDAGGVGDQRQDQRRRRCRTCRAG